MSKRFLATYTLLLVAVLSLSYLQNLYYPAVPEGDNEKSVVAQNDSQDESDNNQIEESPVTKAEESQTDKKDEAVTDVASLDSNQDAKENLSADSEETSREGEETSVEKPVWEPSKLYTLGSIGSESDSRYLITLDSAGGTVRRIELNFRNSNDIERFKYRDLEFKGGYLGELDCVNSPEGCRIRAVGNGTPAHSAGLKVGDVVAAVNDEPVVTPEDFNDILQKLKPGQQVSVKVLRNGSEITASIVLTDKPIELMRPQPDILEYDWKSRPSFRSTLRQPGADEVWEELSPAMMDGTWELEAQTEDSIAFSYTLSQEDLESTEPPLKGPIKFTKTYSIAQKVDDGESGEEKDFHFLMDLKIENLSDQAQEICYQLDGPLGTPTETWWYQNKIHGRNWAIGYIAGARDVVGSTGQEEFTFFGGPEIADNLTASQPKYFWVLTPPAQNDETSQQVNYLSVDTQYFNVALIPDAKEDNPFTAYSVLADSTDVEIPDNVKEQKLVDCTFRMFKVLDMKPKETYQQSFEIFAGPKEAPILARYGLEDVRSFGWFAMFSKPLCALLRFFHTITFQLGYGIPIILLTMLVRSLMIPVSRKAALNAQMMQYLQPQMKEIADKYKDDMEKRGQAQRDLFRKYNYNPLSGCLVGLIQLPIFIGLYRGLSVDIALRDQPLLPGLGWCSNLSAPDQLWYWKDTLPSFLGFLTNETGFLGPYLNILPIITCVLFIIQQKMFTPPPTDEQQEMMQKVMKYAMVFMGVMFFKVPAGLCLYFITSSMWGIAERKLLPKPELDTSKLDTVSDRMSKGSAAQKKQQAKLEQEKQKRIDDVEEKKRRDKERKKKLKRREA